MLWPSGDGKRGQKRWMSTLQKLRCSRMRNDMNNPKTLLGVSHICLCFLGGFEIVIFYPLLVFWERDRFDVFVGQ